MGRIILTAIALAVLAAAQDGAALYKSKCANCHGPKGEGKAAIKKSNLLAPEVKKRSDAELADAIAKGAARGSAHAYEKKGVTPDQVKMLVEHIRALQKKSE